jgi:hypothetical protein
MGSVLCANISHARVDNNVHVYRDFGLGKRRGRVGEMEDMCGGKGGYVGGKLSRVIK